jgi:hypothetical protein
MSLWRTTLEIKFNLLERATDGDDYNASNYPSSGLYKKTSGTNIGWYFFVDKTAVVVYSLPPSVIEPIMLKNTRQAPTSLDDILKVIAVTQKPDLVKDLYENRD